MENVAILPHPTPFLWEMRVCIRFALHDLWREAFLQTFFFIREGANKCNAVLQCGAFSSQRQRANTV